MKKRLAFVAFAVIAIIALAVVAILKTNPLRKDRVEPESKFELNSPVIAEDGEIPDKYTCRSENVSPPLTISGVPEDTVSLALIMHDPDAPNGDFLHWTVWNIASSTTKITEGTVPANAVQGTNGFGKVGYGGPCPPSGTHRYKFDLYALNTSFDLDAGTMRPNLEQAINGHIIGQTKLVGTVTAK